jgi:hypothetical protein
LRCGLIPHRRKKRCGNVSTELSRKELIAKLDQVFTHTTPDQDVKDWMIKDEWDALIEELDQFRDHQAAMAAAGNYINDPLSKRVRVYQEMAKLIGTLEVDNWELRKRIEELEKKHDG